jgi:uncharacterized membrane protein
MGLAEFGFGLGVPWPGKDFALLVFVALFLFVSLSAVRLARRSRAREVT